MLAKCSGTHTRALFFLFSDIQVHKSGQVSSITPIKFTQIAYLNTFTSLYTPTLLHTYERVHTYTYTHVQTHTPLHDFFQNRNLISVKHKLTCI